MTSHSRLEIKPLPKHDYVLITLAEEQLNGKKLSEYDYLGEYKIVDYFEYEKTDPFPYGLLLLSTGQEIESEKIWRAYNKSNKIYFVICQKN